jgi:hypothetical protein
LAKGLSSLFTKNSDKTHLIHSNLRDVINPIIKLCIKIITTDEKTVSDEFILSFNEIVDFYSASNNSHKKIKIEADIIENINTMGSFGKSIKNRRYSAYFCFGIMRITDSFNTDLFNRIIMLSSDSERTIRQEIAHHIKFICNALKESYVKNSIFPLLENYSNDLDYIVKCESIHSFLTIYNDYPDEDFLFNINKIIYGLFENKTKELTIDTQQFLIKILRVLLTVDWNLVNNRRPFLNTIKMFLNNFVLAGNFNKFSGENFIKIEYLIQDFELITIILGKDNESVSIELLSLIIHEIFDDDNGSKSKNFNKFNNYNSTCNSDSLSHPSTTYYPQFENGARQCFFENIEKIMLRIEKDILNKLLLTSKLFKFESGNESKIFLSLVIKYLEIILKTQENLNNFDFLLYFHANFTNFENFVMDPIQDWRNASNFIKALIE